MDGVEGPFSLEIDYIGVLKDDELKENLAYETYKIAKYVSNTQSAQYTHTYIRMKEFQQVDGF